MGFKGVSIRPTGRMLQYGNIDLNKAVLIQKVPRRLPELRATDEALSHLGVNIHVNIAPAQALFFISKALAVRHRSQRFSQ